MKILNLVTIATTMILNSLTFIGCTKSKSDTAFVQFVDKSENHYLAAEQIANQPVSDIVSEQNLITPPRQITSTTIFQTNNVTTTTLIPNDNDLKLNSFELSESVSFEPKLNRYVDLLKSSRILYFGAEYALRIKLKNNSDKDLQITDLKQGPRQVVSILSDDSNAEEICKSKIKANSFCLLKVSIRISKAKDNSYVNSNLQLKDTAFVILNNKIKVPIDLNNFAKVKESYLQADTSENVIPLNNIGERFLREKPLFGHHPNLGSVLLGTKRRFQITLLAKGNGVFDNFQISNLPEGFQYTGGQFPGELGTCKFDLFKRSPYIIPVSPATKCTLDLTFKADKLGEHIQPAWLQFSTGVRNVKVAIPFRAEVIDPTLKENVLFVYNSLNSESVDVKEFYRSHRPQTLNMNYLELQVPNFPYKVMDEKTYREKVYQPILNWLKSNPDNKIRYLILARGIHLRTFGNELSSKRTQTLLADQTRFAAFQNGENDLFGKYLFELVEGKWAPTANRIRVELIEEGFPNNGDLLGMKITHLDMGSLEATQAYIKKLENMGSQSTSSVVAGLSNANLSENFQPQYFLFDANWFSEQASKSPYGKHIKTLMSEYDSNIKVSLETQVQPTITLKDVIGFHTFGFHGFVGGEYAIDGRYKFIGKSDAYIIKTVESFNGNVDWGPQQGNYGHWFSEKAFGGTNYSNTPLAALVHVEEPYFAGAWPAISFLCWEKGEIIADCANQTMVTSSSAVIGDPLVSLKKPNFELRKQEN